MNETNSTYPGAMALCENCGSSYSDTLTRCPHCEPVENDEVFTCTACNEEYRGGDACPACGTLNIEVPCEDHPDRKATGRCVICGKAVCVNCREDSRRSCLCEEHRAIPVIEGWTQVYSATREFEAQLLRDNLLSEGIDAQLLTQKDRAFTVDLGELSIVRLLVPAWQYQQALQLIRDHTDVDGEVAFACPSCGEAYETDAVECAACGHALP